MLIFFLVKKNIIESPEYFKTIISQHLGYSSWKLVTQKEIDNFASATEDFQWIHVDKNRVKQDSPFKSTIAHGYYSLSLIPKFISEIWECKNIKLILNYGAEKIRFISPVKCNSKIRASIVVQDAQDYKGGILLKSKIEIEIKDSNKPALIAETLSLLFSK